jgi:uncharacterized protein YjbI with pentapeptide repeats
MGWLQNHGWVAGLIVAAALALAALAWRAARRPPQATQVPGAAARRQVDLTFAAAVLITLIVGFAAVLWLLEQADQVPAGKERATLRADAIKTGATIALGTGGAAYLLLAYRRQRLDEVDTRERRITELYTKAVEQLGHEKAPVRLGALYSLERLAQNNPEHRQTVVDVFCAYLRMPYTLPARWATRTEPRWGKAVPPAEDGIPAAHPVPAHDPAQEELQVREAAQRILVAHLHLPPGIFSAAAQRRPPSPRRAFWPGIRLDLTGATLVDFNFESASVIQAQFNGATFHGVARFDDATFHGLAGFDEATFHGGAWLYRATFHGGAAFSRATFQGVARFDDATFHGGSFDDATFHGNAAFSGAIFQSDLWFGDATFQGGAWFDGATFHGDAGLQATFHGVARFDDATFHGLAGFNGATFHGLAGFNGATFHGNARFERATFRYDAQFDGATFEGAADFNGATFEGAAAFAEAEVLHLDDPDPNQRRRWPQGYIVRADPADPIRGTLIHVEQTGEQERAVPPPDPTGR